LRQFREVFVIAMFFAATLPVLALVMIRTSISFHHLQTVETACWFPDVRLPSPVPRIPFLAAAASPREPVRSRNGVVS
jgi:hypothetical protein